VSSEQGAESREQGAESSIQKSEEAAYFPAIGA